MTTLRRLLRFLADSLPLYSYRNCSRHWLAGSEFGQRQIGLTRDERGRFKRI